MLENEQTLDWEELLPAMMMAYSCHEQRATQESPFFLTYLHSPRLPFFNLEKPQPLYGESYVDDAFWGLQYSFRHAKDTGESFPPLKAPAAFSKEGDESVEHNSPSDDFSAFIESASESEDDETPVGPLTHLFSRPVV